MNTFSQYKIFLIPLKNKLWNRSSLKVKKTRKKNANFLKCVGHYGLVHSILRTNSPDLTECYKYIIL